MRGDGGGGEGGAETAEGLNRNSTKSRPSEELLPASSPKSSPQDDMTGGPSVIVRHGKRGISQIGTSVVLTMLILVLIALAIASLVIAGLRWNQPCRSAMVQDFLVVNGVISLLLLGFLIREYYVDRHRKRLLVQGRDYKPRFARFFTFASGATFIFWFIWFLVGNGVVYSMPRDQCDAVLYDFVFAFLTIIWVVLSLSCLWTCANGVSKSRQRRAGGSMHNSSVISPTEEDLNPNTRQSIV